jgi:predicted metalloprotease
VKDADREAERMQRIMGKFKPDSFVHGRLEERVNAAKRASEDVSFYLKQARGK